MKDIFAIFISILCFTSTVEAKVKNTSSISFETDVDQLFIVLKKNKTTNITEAIDLFDNKYFKTGQYSLIFDSMSPQSSSAKAPRVLLFGKDKKLRVGFNHRSKNGQDLEVIQWRDTTATWEFREIIFNSNGPTISKANPNLCIQCHDDHKPKFKGHLVQSLANIAKGQLDISPFVKLIKSDSIYRRLESPLTGL